MSTPGTTGKYIRKYKVPLHRHIKPQYDEWRVTALDEPKHTVEKAGFEVQFGRNKITLYMRNPKTMEIEAVFEYDDCNWTHPQYVAVAKWILHNVETVAQTQDIYTVSA